MSAATTFGPKGRGAVDVGGGPPARSSRVLVVGDGGYGRIGLVETGPRAVRVTAVTISTAGHDEMKEWR